MKKSFSKLPVILGVFATVWLLILSLSLSQTNANLTAFKNTPIETPITDELDILKISLLDVISRVQRIETQPSPITHTQFTATQKENEKEFERIQQRFTNITSLITPQADANHELIDLRQRLEQLEARIDSAGQKVSDEMKPMDLSPKPSVVSKPQPLAPHFNIIGVEMRGGEQLLVISPKNSSTTPYLLRIGDATNQWLLTGISGNQATFTINKRNHSLTIPD